VAATNPLLYAGARMGKSEMKELSAFESDRSSQQKIERDLHHNVLVATAMYYRDQAQRLEELLYQCKHSTSWKITYPLRFVARFLRRILGNEDI
jgi:hypothetical protein